MYFDSNAGECQLKGTACTSLPARPSERTTAKKIRMSSPKTSTRSALSLISIPALQHVYELSGNIRAARGVHLFGTPQFVKHADDCTGSCTPTGTAIASEVHKARHPWSVTQNDR